MTPTMVSVFNCSLRSLRIALGIRLLRRRSQTKSVSAPSSSARRRAIRCSIARSARCGSRSESAYFVVARRPKACPLAPCMLLAPLAEAGACEPLPSSLARRRKGMSARSLVQDSVAPASQHGGARVHQLASLVASRRSLSGDGHRDRDERVGQRRRNRRVRPDRRPTPRLRYAEQLRCDLSGR